MQPDVEFTPDLTEAADPADSDHALPVESVPGQNVADGPVRLPTMGDLESLALDLDEIDSTLAQLDSE